MINCQPKEKKTKQGKEYKLEEINGQQGEHIYNTYNNKDLI